MSANFIRVQSIDNIASIGKSSIRKKNCERCQHSIADVEATPKWNGVRFCANGLCWSLPPNQLDGDSDRTLFMPTRELSGCQLANRQQRGSHAGNIKRITPQLIGRIYIGDMLYADFLLSPHSPWSPHKSILFTSV